MKKILIITTRKRLISSLAFCLILCAAIVLAAAAAHLSKSTHTISNNGAYGIQELEKENEMLGRILSSLVPREHKTIYEDERRNIFKNAGISPPPPIPASPLSKVISHGTEVKFNTLLDDPQYLRPVYDPGWKGAFFRMWLYLPHKNIEARHKIFAFSLGGSMNFDITGSLGFSPSVAPKAAIDNHRNINFLIYGFRVGSVKVFQNQVALTGEPKQTGAWIVSVVQNDLLPEGIDREDFIFHLSTPEGYEIDFINHNVIRYEYLMQQIEEHTVKPSFAANDVLEELLLENTALKKELSFFIPLEEETITQESCRNLSLFRGEPENITSAVQHGKQIPFNVNYMNPQYKRPLYDPLWKTNYKRKWCYIPVQICSNMSRLFTIPENLEKQHDFFGTLGFYEKFQQVKKSQYGFLIYSFRVSRAVFHKDQLFLIGVPLRSGAQIISVNRPNGKDRLDLPVSLVTPDYRQIEIDMAAP